MRELLRFWAKHLLVVVLACGIIPLVASAADETSLTKDQITEFLQTAEVIKSKPSSKGVTHPSRLTLSNGTITHDASFQTIDEHSELKQLESGHREYNFVDSYKFNIAAYRLSELLGIDNMLPVYVERKWQGKTGSLSWWLPVQMDEADRMAKKIVPPDIHAWNEQMNRIRVFDELIYDTDPNLTNVLIGEDWTVWRIDFTRAFRTYKDLRLPQDLVKCDRQLFEKLKALKGNELADKTKNYLTKDEVNAVMARRDKIVAIFQGLIAEKGEKEVLY
ncbi:MAG TPA: hypothetical protein VFC15_19705 [Candidatus Limnocylindrales bacterium]|jgi:hypothetical protein|nr:hypothetical protein [Candidatus Limnocylindrales bacterium]